jgi:hypothetical protein
LAVTLPMDLFNPIIRPACLAVCLAGFLTGVAQIAHAQEKT